MLWLIKNGASHQIISCNIHEEKGKHQLWVERPNGKTMKIAEDSDKAEILLIKNAIDDAIKQRDPVLEL